MPGSEPPNEAPASPDERQLAEIFRVEPAAEQGRLALIGELDIAGVPALAQAIADARSSTDGLTFDLQRLTFLDSSGLNELLKTVREHDGPVRLVSPQPNVLRVLDIAGVMSVFEIVDAQSDPSD
jgi:anti-anti-sigma factor